MNAWLTPPYRDSYPADPDYWDPIHKTPANLSAFFGTNLSRKELDGQVMATYKFSDESLSEQLPPVGIIFPVSGRVSF
jgi:hypothetical protein